MEILFLQETNNLNGNSRCKCFDMHEPKHTSIHCECECHLEQDSIWIQGHWRTK